MMPRRAVPLLACLALLAACSADVEAPADRGAGRAVAEVDTDPDAPSLEPVELSEDAWRERLSPQAFAVLREDATEPRESSVYTDAKTKGTYRCAGCDLALFASDTKFDSGTGWPSFWAPIHPDHVGTETDTKFFMVRTEAHCARCGGHLGHVFDDGPEPTGDRWCMNGAALVLDEGEVTRADRDDAPTR